MSPSAIVRADGLFEAALGLVLIVGAATGWLDSGDFPSPVGTALIVVVGVGLIALGAILWRVATGAVSRLLRHLAVGNSVSAAAAIVWCVAAEGFSDAGSAIVLVTASGLLALAAGQLAATPMAGRALRR